MQFMKDLIIPIFFCLLKDFMLKNKWPGVVMTHLCDNFSFIYFHDPVRSGNLRCMLEITSKNVFTFVYEMMQNKTNCLFSSTNGFNFVWWNFVMELAVAELLILSTYDMETFGY